VNRSRVDADASAAEIDRQVLAAEREGGVYEIDLDTLRTLDPDLVVTQGVCEVCAVDGVLVEEAVAETGVDAEVLTTDPHTFADVLDDIERVGRALDREDRARDLVARLRERARRVEERAASAVETRGRPEVAVLDWTAPPMVAGHWVPGLVERAGGAYGLADAGAASGPVEWATVREYDPDVLVVAPCGFDLDQTARNLDDLRDRPGWTDLRAVREGQVYALDGHDHVNRPGPRLVETLEHLAGLVHPTAFETPPPEVCRPVADLLEDPLAGE
jgi:iron complex transport system substrate-binding protein